MSLPAECAPFEREFDLWLLDQELELAKLLAGKTSPVQLEDRDARCLENAILAELDERGGNKEMVIAWLRIAYLRVKALKEEQGLDLPSLRLAVSVRPQKSPFVRARVDELPKVLAWRAALFSWLKHGARVAATNDLRCAALISAVLCGGLLDSRKVSALSLVFDKPLQFTRSLVFVEFAFPYRHLTVDLHQRWFPDPLTEILLVRGMDLETPVAEISTQKLATRLRHFLEKMGVQKKYLPKSISSLIESASIYWESLGSQADIRYARGLVVSQSLKHSVWIRLQNELGAGEKDESGEVEMQVAQLQNGSAEDQDEFDEPPMLSLWWLAFLKGLEEIPVVGRPLMEVLHAYEALLQTQKIIPTTATIFVRWMRTMLNGKTTSGDQLQSTTIFGYFKQVVTALNDVYGDREITHDQTSSLIESYGSILEMHPEGMDKTRMARGLREFHGYLVQHENFDPVDHVDTFGREAEIAVVEARIISVDDYLRSDRLLGEYLYKGKALHLVEAARLAFMLAFRTGMRRMEIFMLRMEDVHLGPHRSDILVRPHAKRRLKSLSSKRRIPLDPLLDPDELERLKKWFEEQLMRKAVYLFSDGKKSMISVEGAVDLIHQAMRNATGDMALHLHHLRHSFATWLYWKLRWVAYPQLVEHFRHLPKTFVFLQSGAVLRQQLLSGQMSIPSRSEIYCVTRLLGHAAPNISMNHYIHGADLMVYGLACSQLDEEDKMILSEATALPTRTALRYRDSEGGVLRAFRARHKPFYHTEVLVPERPKSKRGRKPNITPDRIVAFTQRFETVWRVLQLCDQLKELVTIARELNLTATEVSQQVKVGKEVAKCLGLSALSPPRPKGHRANAFHERVLHGMARLSLKDPALLLEGIHIFLGHFSKHKKDVIFRGCADEVKAIRYLEFLRELRLNREEVQLVSREGSARHPNLDNWIKVLKLSGADRVKHIASVNMDKAAYDRWIGIEMVYADKPRSAQAILMSIVAIFMSGQDYISSR